MCTKYPVKVCAIMEEPKEKLPADPIPSISLQNNFRFEEDGIRCWKAYGTGEGLFLAINIVSIIITIRLVQIKN